MALLPSPDTCSFQRDTVIDAYSMCSRREKSVMAETMSQARERRLINIRIVGFLILHWPTGSQKALENLALEITAYEEEKIEELGQRYYDHLLRLFKSSKERVSTPSLDISRPSFDTKTEFVGALLVEAPQDHRRAKKHALVRDGFKCVVSGRCDASAVDKSLELEEEHMASGKESSLTECAHIFSESTNANITGPGSDDKKAYTASVWTIIKSFGYEKIPEELNGSNVHRLENVLTLDRNVHGKFDALNIWFERTASHAPYLGDTLNKYKLCSRKSHYMGGYPEFVTFMNHSEEHNFPLPSPTYLEIHAACAKIAHLSGATEQINSILDELEDTRVLAVDGTSADLLGHAILASGF